MLARVPPTYRWSRARQTVKAIAACAPGRVPARFALMMDRYSAYGVWQLHRSASYTGVWDHGSIRSTCTPTAVPRRRIRPVAITNSTI